MISNCSAIEQYIVVGIYAGNRERDYTLPDYEHYGKSVVSEIMPFIERHFRVRSGRLDTMTMGSALGCVVSFYLGWQYPEVFGSVACLSSTFSYKDNLLERVQREDITPRLELGIYLASGWPGDNHDETLDMAFALESRGFQMGHNLHHLVFPMAGHNESSWAARCHLPLQLLPGNWRGLIDQATVQRIMGQVL